MKMNDRVAGVFTIRPRNKEERKEFAEFRNTDVGEMIQYVFGFATVATLILSAVLVYEPTDINAVKLISQILIDLVIIAAWLIGSRFPEWFAFIIAVSMFMMHLITAVSIDVVLVVFEGTFVGMQSRIGGLYIYSLILAPSMSYMLFYSVIFYLNIAQTIERFVKDEAVDYHVIWVMLVFFLFSFWFIFQKRELKRFYQKYDAEKKERDAVDNSNQLTNVLNL